MKLVIRIDDFGYTDAFNLGGLETIDNGVASHIETMLDCPGTVNALKLLKDRPWLSVGWHFHCLGRSIVDPKLIPSFAREDGRFRTAMRSGESADPKYDEVLAELRAEIEQCIRVLGRAPDFMQGGSQYSGINDAIVQLCEEYGIGFGAFQRVDHNDGHIIPPNDRFKDSKLYMPNQYATGCKALQAENAAGREEYNPITYFLEDQDKILEKEMAMIAFHPGYVDAFIMNNNGYLEKFYRACCGKDIAALCSDWLKKWIIDNRIELISMRDAVYGTRDYQNHLKIIGSPLYAG